MQYAKFLFLGGIQFFCATVFSQIQFINKSNLLAPQAHHSGVVMAVCDMNGDGLDDIVRLDQGINLNIQYQTAPNQAFTNKQLGALPGADIWQKGQWAICTADYDNNGFADVLTGGRNDGIKVFRASNDGLDYDLSFLENPGTFVQTSNFADINNDGLLDAFVCNDDSLSRIFINDGAGGLNYDRNVIDLATVPTSDNSGNYGSVWSDVDNDGDLDLYVAHCRELVTDPTDARRINQLFLNNGDGTYTQDIGNTSGLRIGAQSWTADFGDIDNDGDFDCFITNHDVSSQILENDGAGHFTDISASAGILNNLIGVPIQGLFRDFDNDGFVDILVVGKEIQYLLKNIGNKTFAPAQNIFTFNKMYSVALGDLNDDGFQDIYAGYGKLYIQPSSIPDALWMNVGNNNHFFGLKLRGVQSNRSAVGTKVQLYSALGIQTREVRSGESYGISNSLHIHFGMGQESVIDSVVINWPSGIRDVLFHPVLDQYVTFTEGGCAVQQVVTDASGPTTFCPGDSVDLQAPSGFNYLWNTGDTSRVITIKSSGEYNVTVTTPAGCSAISNTTVVITNPIETPLITVAGDSIICAGDAVELSVGDYAGYEWSTGDTTPTILASEAGAYFVTVQGLCTQVSTPPVHVQTLIPDLPIVTNDAVFVDSVAELSATGDLVKWYADPDSMTPFYTGNSYTTPPLTASTTYWVSNTEVFGQPNQFVGMETHQGSVFSDNSFSGGLYFNCYSPFTLEKTTVFTSKSGNRKIDLYDENMALIHTKTFNIPVGATVLDLDFEIPVGNDFFITTDTALNKVEFGTYGPQLRRSSEGCMYPYEIPNLVSIHNTNSGPGFYYFFFNWEIATKSYTCESPRVPVTADVSVSATNTPVWATGLQIFPNPTSGRLQVSGKNFQGGSLLASIKNAQGVSLQTSILEAVSGTIDYQTDLSALPKGVYWLELAGADGVVRRMVVVQ